MSRFLRCSCSTITSVWHGIGNGNGNGRQRLLYYLLFPAASDNDPCSMSMSMSRLCYNNSLIIRLKSTAAAAASDPQSFTVSYLITKLGFTPESASRASKYVRFKTPKNPDSVISFLQNSGFSKSQIKTMAFKTPPLLASNTQKTLLPKMEFLRSKGFSSPDLARLLTANPSILLRSLNKQIIPFFDSLRNLIHSDENTVIRVIKIYPILLTYDIDAYVFPNCNTLTHHGVPESIALKGFQNFPGCFVLRPDRFKAIVEQVKQMGFNPLKMHFIHAVSVRSQNQSSWDKKVHLYIKWGWSQQDVLDAFRKYPRCMVSSQEKIEAIMDFLVNQMGFQSLLIAKQASILTRSLERRIVPRALFARHLSSKGFTEKFSVSTLFDTSEKLFLKHYVNKYEDKAPELVKLYKEKVLPCSKPRRQVQNKAFKEFHV